MRLDLLESQSLQYLLAVHATRYVGLVGEYQQTGTRETLSSWSVSRIYCAPAKGDRETRRTSSWSSPCSSSLQSSILSLSVASTTQMSASVFSK